MDEITLVRTAHGDPKPPSEQAVSDARGRLFEEMRAVPQAQPARPRRFPLGLKIAVAAAGVTALAVPAGLAGLRSSDSGTPAAQPPAAVGPGPQEPVVLSAPQLLNVAAVRADRAPATTGRYWRTSSLVSHTMFRVGTGANAYTLEVRSVQEEWTPSGGGPSYFGTRDLGARPATPADVAKWKKAGSPTRWNLGPTDTVDHKPLVVTAAAAPGRLQPSEFEPTFHLGAVPLSLAEIRAIPSDPTALRTYLTGILTRMVTEEKVEPRRVDQDVLLFSLASQLLSDLPAEPATRAGAFRLLAALPNVRTTGSVTDPLGRRGTGVTLDFGDANALQLVIDPATGELLGSRTIGAKKVTTSTLSAAWTNRAPAVPAATLPSR